MLFEDFPMVPDDLPEKSAPFDQKEVFDPDNRGEHMLRSIPICCDTSHCRERYGVGSFCPVTGLGWRIISFLPEIFDIIVLRIGSSLELPACLLEFSFQLIFKFVGAHGVEEVDFELFSHT